MLNASHYVDGVIVMHGDITLSMTMMMMHMKFVQVKEIIKG